jgi:hypothetical protein
MSEYLPEEEELLVEQELPEGEPQTFSERLAKAAPWWMISILSHSVAAVICVFIVAVANRTKEEEIVMVSPVREVQDIPPKIIPKNPVEKPLELEKQVQDPVIYKAPQDEITETPNDEEFQKPKGESMDALSDKPFKGKSVYDVVGAGGGGGGKYGGRFGGKLLRAANGGGGRDTEEAVLNALRWLARHQNHDGSWSAQKHADNCGKIPGFSGRCIPNKGAENFNVGLTGLALLAFLGAGYTHLSKDVFDGICFGTVVRNGVQHLMRVQEPSGRVGPDDSKYMYNHLIATFAMCEAFGMTGSAMFKENAQRAVDYTCQAQNPNKAWRYSARCGDNDTSVSGWAGQALKSAETAGLNFNKEAYRGLLDWIDECTESSYGGVGYIDTRADAKVVKPGDNEHFSHHPALTAIGVMTRVFLNKRGDPRTRGGMDKVIGDLPDWDAQGLKVDFYYWYYASYAIFLYDGATGPYWKKWNERVKTAILDKQNRAKGDCRHGSWEPVDRWSTDGGRVYTTAMGALILEVYYRYPSSVNAYGGMK